MPLELEGLVPPSVQRTEREVLEQVGTNREREGTTYEGGDANTGDSEATETENESEGLPF